MSNKEEISNAVLALIQRIEEVANEIVAAADVFEELQTQVLGVKHTSDEAVTVLQGAGVSGSDFTEVSSSLEDFVREIQAVHQGLQDSLNENTGLKATAETILTEVNTIG